MLLQIKARRTVENMPPHIETSVHDANVTSADQICTQQTLTVCGSRPK